VFNNWLISKEASVNAMLSLRTGFAENHAGELMHCVMLMTVNWLPDGS